MKILPPTPENIQHAAQLLREGGLVVMPTETVYGLACNATDPNAIHKVFEAKSRPTDNPLIVHIACAEDLSQVASSWPDYIEELTARFWPGPLTLVLPKQTTIPDEVTAGLQTVGVRVPNHPVAIILIEASEVPLSAPSANRFMQLSPTRAEHIDPELEPYLDLILDGSPCSVGVESTVLDCTEMPPKILRAGGISRQQIEEVLGISIGESTQGDVRKSPGTYLRHYSPKAKVILTQHIQKDQAGLTFDSPRDRYQIQMSLDPVAYAKNFYHALYQLDSLHLKTIYVEEPPLFPEWEAIWDRLLRASYEENEGQ